MSFCGHRGQDRTLDIRHAHLLLLSIVSLRIIPNLVLVYKPPEPIKSQYKNGNKITRAAVKDSRQTHIGLRDSNLNRKII